MPEKVNRVEGENSEAVKEIISMMQKAVNDISNAFVKDRGLAMEPNISPMLDLCKYEPGGSIGIHYDGQDGDRSIMYTMVMYFNDDQEGGEVSFTIADKDSTKRSGTDLNDPNIDF
jgi:hypothetical protein